MSLDDYKLLESMNNATAEKYQAMTKVAANVAQNIGELNEKYERLLPKLEIIDKLDKKVTGLEKMAYAIDAYSKRLGKCLIVLVGHLMPICHSTLIGLIYRRSLYLIIFHLTTVTEQSVGEFCRILTQFRFVCACVTKLTRRRRLMLFRCSIFSDSHSLSSFALSFHSYSQY